MLEEQNTNDHLMAFRLLQYIPPYIWRIGFDFEYRVAQDVYNYNVKHSVQDLSNYPDLARK
jgi:hypothetical protein